MMRMKIGMIHKVIIQRLLNTPTRFIQSKKVEEGRTWSRNLELKIKFWKILY